MPMILYTVISETYPIEEKKGKTTGAVVRFHNEKTPSFSVTPDKGFFYCFGCRESGNVISFLMKYDNLTFPEAIERLANVPTLLCQNGRYRQLSGNVWLGWKLCMR